MKIIKNVSLKSFDFNKIFRKLLAVIPIGVFINISCSFLMTGRIDFFNGVKLSFGYFFLAIVLTLVPWLTHTIRLHIWTNFLGYKIPMIENFKVVLGTELGSAISPTTVGGTPVKIGMLMQKGVKPGIATSLAALNSMEDNIFLLFALPFAMSISAFWKSEILRTIWQKLSTPLFWILAVTFTILIVSFVTYKIVRFIHIKKYNSKPITLPIYLKIKQKLLSFWGDFKSVFLMICEKGKLRFLLSISITGVQWICRYSVLTALVASFGIPVDPVKFFVLQWIVFTIMTFVPTPGAAAGAEAAFYLIYQSFVPGSLVGMLNTGWRFLTFYFLLILGVILFILLTMPQKWFQKRPIKTRRAQPIRYNI